MKAIRLDGIEPSKIADYHLAIAEPQMNLKFIRRTGRGEEYNQSGDVDAHKKQHTAALVAGKTEQMEVFTVKNTAKDMEKTEVRCQACR